MAASTVLMGKKGLAEVASSQALSRMVQITLTTLLWNSLLRSSSAPPTLTLRSQSTGPRVSCTGNNKVEVVSLMISVTDDPYMCMGADVSLCWVKTPDCACQVCE